MESVILDIKKYKITEKKIQVPSIVDDIEYSIEYTDEQKDAETVLNDLFKYICQQKYKTLKVTNVQTNFKWNEILDNKISYDIQTLFIDQEYFDVCQGERGKILFKYDTPDPDKSISHITTHQMIDPKYHPYIPNVYLVILKNESYIKIETEVEYRLEGFYTKCYVNAENPPKLVVRTNKNFDIKKLFIK